MKILSTLCSLLALGATPGLAQDWNGFYVGVGASSVDGGLEIPSLPFDYSGTDGAALSVYSGYNYQMPSNLVIGAELSYGDINTMNMPLHPFHADGLLHARARIGYAMGNVMPYAAVGAARSEIGIVGGPTTNETGVSLGLGAEVRVGENVNLRAEYTNVRFNGVGTGVWIGPGVDYNLEMLTVGLGFQF